MRFSLGNNLRHRESYPYLVHLRLPTSSLYFDGTRQFVVQIPSMDEILMRYWVEVQARTTRISIMYKSKFRMGEMRIRRFLMITCEVLLRVNLRNTRIIALI